MYVCYIDESGTPDIPGNTSHFVLAGICIPISEWKAIDISISAFLKSYGLEGAEFHTAWILRKYLEQSRIPNFEKNGLGRSPLRCPTGTDSRATSPSEAGFPRL